MLGAKFILLCVAALFACFALAAVLKSRRRDEPMITPTSTTLPASSSFGDAHPRVSVELGRELLGMLEAGEREKVVWIVRQRTGLGAAEAEAMIGRIEALRKRLES